MTTAQAAIDRTLGIYLQADKGTSRNKLAANLSDSAETVELERPLARMGAGSKLSIGLEDIYVWSVDEGARTADVDRGEYGSTAAAHSTGDVVYVDPDYTPFEILQALNAAVSDLVGEGIYQVSEVDIDLVANVYGYDLTSTTNVLGLNDAWVSNLLSSSTGEWQRYRSLHLQMNAPTASFPSGTAVQIQGPFDASTTLRVSYRHELDASLAALDDDVETVTGVESDAVQLLCIGAALHLTAGKEVERNEISVASNRPPSEVPASAWTQAGSNLRRLWREGVRAEKARLARKNPIRLNAQSPLSGV